ncbi:MAG: ACT domain-containing protein [Anaerolineae bacterium]|nr:ACT domain-containing protein [Anaerolineae bacterium]
MQPTGLTLSVLPDRFAVCQLPPDSPLPSWASGSLVAFVRTADELSVVCAESAVPLGVPREGDLSALKVEGTLEFGLTGILAGISATLAAVGITIFAISTYNTDYILVRHASLERACRALRLEGYTVLSESKLQ